MTTIEIYQLNGLKIKDPSRQLVIEDIQYANAKNAVLSGVKDIIKQTVTIPEYNPETERLEELDSGQYQVVPLTTKEIEQIAVSKLNKLRGE